MVSGFRISITALLLAQVNSAKLLSENNVGLMFVVWEVVLESQEFEPLLGIFASC